jgi:pilus assembly protein CpaB
MDADGTGARMNARKVLPAFLVALLMAALFTFWLSKRLAKPSLAVVTPMRKIVAVTKNIEAGQTLQASSLQLVDWPSSQELSGAIARPVDAVGRVVLFPLSTGQAVVERELAAAGTGNGLMGKIPEGMRAISLQSDAVAGVAGFIAPGSHVDVLVTYHPGNIPTFITSTVLQDAQVLATDQKMSLETDFKPSTAANITLLVTPQDAEKLTAASALGKILFVLRNGTDRVIVPGLSPQLLSFGGAPTPAPARAPAAHHEATAVAHPTHAAAGFTVQTIAGNKQTEETF